MQSKREYAIAKGLAQPGRGRMSRAAWDAIKEARKKGIQFSDTSEEKAKARTAALERREALRDEKAKERQSRETTGVQATKPPRGDRPNGIYVFENPDGTKFKRTHAEACAGCHYSMQWCYCPGGPTMFVYPYRSGTTDQRASLVDVITTAEPQQGARRKGR